MKAKFVAILLLVSAYVARADYYYGICACSITLGGIQQTPLVPVAGEGGTAQEATKMAEARCEAYAKKQATYYDAMASYSSTIFDCNIRSF